MIIMMAIPIILTVVPVMLYQVILSLCKRKSTSTHYFWTYTMMIYIWLVFSVTGIGSVWDIISKGGLISTSKYRNYPISVRRFIHLLHEYNYAYAVRISIAVYMEKF